MSKICILDGTGHTEAAVWGNGDPNALLIASETFNRLKGEGYSAFEMLSDGTAEGVIDEFNPEADEIIFLRPFAGG